ncbi:hypothetical protein [Thermococcus sibiricus]|uniref:Uncharacterized protein n=1 Tax=Thermococcus sibiricus (strain DSM 12597 / MM 739) TaxID=604354 RepID=C6A2N3_THESM|nr:hypothetical protein [Thermococcus sibiricus]ACS89878.1 hypothetical protein TSIB_0817 [Thermococcus sibiricus MM 739]MBC7095090.1 hypothetical protein [Thermococcus sp.]
MEIKIITRYYTVKNRTIGQCISCLEEFKQYRDQQYNYVLTYKVIKPPVNISKNVETLLKIGKEDIKNYYLKME